METETFDLTKVSKQSLKKERLQKLKQKSKEAKKWKARSKESKKKTKDPFPGDAPVPKELVKKYKKAEAMETSTITIKKEREKYRAQEKRMEYAAKQAARVERLNKTESAGFLEIDEGECPTQHDLADAVDITSATKYFELFLKDFGPYRVNYTRNGRHMLLGGSRGHIAAFDWQTKKLHCEMNVMETVKDIAWFHNQNYFSVAQKEWTYVYDNQGIELHCLKGLHQVLRLEFLHYHTLLAAGHARSYLSFVDVSMGKKVSGFGVGMGPLDIMCQNPAVGTIHLGHPGGTVTLWKPDVKEMLVKMRCHNTNMCALAVDHTGTYMATSGHDRKLKVYDLRTYKALYEYRVAAAPAHMAFSQRGMLAASIGSVVQVFEDPCHSTLTGPYLRHELRYGGAHGLQFCPYEDVLGVGHSNGFTSMLVPGSGEPNYDAMEANPLETKRQKQQAEVKLLLEKVQPEMISVTSDINQVDAKTLQEKLELKKDLLYIRPSQVEFEPRYKKKGKSKTLRHEARKRGVKAERKLAEVKEKKKLQKQMLASEQQVKKVEKPYTMFDRFKTTE